MTVMSHVQKFIIIRNKPTVYNVLNTIQLVKIKILLNYTDIIVYYTYAAVM